MLLTLLKMRLASLFIPLFTGKKKKRGALLTVLAVLLFLFAAVYFAVIFGSIFLMIGLPLFEARAEYVYFALGGALMLLLMLLGSVMYTKTQLFAANDNELLLSMPIPPHLILLSRLLLPLIKQGAKGLV
jgi:ABC-2 type transport system permease protein